MKSLDHGIIHARRLDTRDHAPAPPVPGILAGLYPARVLDPRRRIETCHDRGADQIAGPISDHQNAPRRQQIRTGTPMNGNGWIVQSRGEPDLNARRWFTAATQVHPRIVVQIGFRDREHCGFRPAHQGNVEQVAFADRCGTHEAEFAFVAGVKSRKTESPATMVIGKVEAGQLILDQQGLTTMSSTQAVAKRNPVVIGAKGQLELVPVARRPRLLQLQPELVAAVSGAAHFSNDQSVVPIDTVFWQRWRYAVRARARGLCTNAGRVVTERSMACGRMRRCRRARRRHTNRPALRCARWANTG